MAINKDVGVTAQKGYLYGYEAMARQVSQEDANYKPYGATGGRGCASCRFYFSPNSCLIVSGDISPTGISDYYAAEVPYTPEPMDVRIVKEATATATTAVTKEGPFSRLIGVLKDFVGAKKTDAPVSSFWVEKDADGRYRAFAIYSNIFKDKHKQIISEAAHKEYVGWVDSDKGIYPEFHLWHGGPLSRFGQVDFVDYLDGFTIASGLVDVDKEYIAEALQEQDCRVSHGFFGLKSSDDIYTLYRSFEVSPLPAGAESNQWTAFDLAFKENLMPFTDAKKKWLKEVAKVDDAKILEMEATTKALGDNLKSLGLEYKEEGVVEATTETVVDGTAATQAAVAASQGVDLSSINNGMTAMVKAIGDLAGVVAGIQSQIAVVTKEVGDVKTASSKSVEDRAGELNLSRVAAAVQGGHVASKSGDTVVEGTAAAAAAKSDEDWFDNVVFAPLGSGAAGGK